MRTLSNYLPFLRSQTNRIGAFLRLAWFLFLIIGVVLALPVRTPAAIGQVQGIAGCSGPNLVSQFSVSFFANGSATKNNLLVLIVGVKDAATVTFINPAGFIPVIAETTSSSAPSQTIYYKIAQGGEGFSGLGGVSVNFSAPTSVCMSVYEYSGITFNSPFHGKGSATGTGTSLSSGTASPFASTDLSVAGFFDNHATAFASNFTNPTGGFTDDTFGGDYGGTNTGHTGFVYADCLGINCSSSTTTTISDGGSWRGQIASFYPKTTTATTNTGANTQVSAGNATLTFSIVTGSGTTTVDSIADPTNPSQGTPPAGITYSSTSPAYNISTTATFAGTVHVCISAATITNQTTFNDLKLLHKEGSTLVDRTTALNFNTKQICGSVTTLSPFIVANSSAPTDAPGSISGQISAEDGAPLAGVVLKLTGTSAATAITDTNGTYRFDNVATSGFYTVSPARANYRFSPANRSFSQLGNHTEAAFTGLPNGDSANPLDTPEYFVRQQYVDVLGREPEEGGLNYWSDQILACGRDEDCIGARRIGVAAAFFIEREYQASGSYIYDVYSGALGRRPQFAEYSADRTQVVGGATLEAAKTLFAESFVQRTEFLAKYQSNSTAESFVDALLANVQAAGGDLSGQRDSLINSYHTGDSMDKSRALVLRAVADDAAFKQAQYNGAFVLTEYFSYLRRDPDDAGYRFWVNVLNFGDKGNYRGMVCSFITSQEYQKRFSSIVSHLNTECGQ